MYLVFVPFVLVAPVAMVAAVAGRRRWRAGRALHLLAVLLAVYPYGLNMAYQRAIPYLPLDHPAVRGVLPVAGIAVTVIVAAVSVAVFLAPFATVAVPGLLMVGSRLATPGPASALLPDFVQLRPSFGGTPMVVWTLLATVLLLVTTLGFRRTSS